MSKLILTFKMPEERSEANLALGAGKLHSVCYDISQYARSLRKYEERKNIPTAEIVDKLNELLSEYYEVEVE